MLAAQAYIELGSAKDAATVLNRYGARLPQPDADMLFAKAYEAAGDRARAVAALQRVHYMYPLSARDTEAEAELARLESLLGDTFPPAMPQARLDRAAKLMRAGQGAKARREYLAAGEQVAGRERELALVRGGTGDYGYLSALKVNDPDADAERIYLMHAISRKNSREQEAEAALEELNRLHPRSPWRLEALVSWGNHHLLRNNVSSYVPLYRACYEDFSTDPQAAYCHWKVAWSAYVRRSAEAQQLLRDHLSTFPESEKTAAANYFLGNYGVVLQRFPMSYYAVLSRAKSKLPPSRTLLKKISLAPPPEVSYRMGRARTLAANGLAEWAEFELRSVADVHPFLVATELGELAAQQGAYERGVRYVKAIAKDYIRTPLEAAPERFWRCAFPLPYRSYIETQSRLHSLDPFLVAALIRQESEFDPKVVSHANAYGLTQVLPSTGRELSRRAGIPRFKPTMLFEPDTNIRLGTMYLKGLLRQSGGNEPATLAAYNAGKRRVDQWSTWYDYREPAEFIETIPISETRNYVQIVLRNADVYRRLYASNGSGG